MITHFNKRIKTWAAVVGNPAYPCRLVSICRHLRVDDRLHRRAYRFRGAGQPRSCAARQGTGPPVATDYFARWQRAGAFSAWPSAVGPFHAVPMHSSCTTNHC
jgi:hypothetical protein